MPNSPPSLILAPSLSFDPSLAPIPPVVASVQDQFFDTVDQTKTCSTFPVGAIVLDLPSQKKWLCCATSRRVATNTSISNHGTECVCHGHGAPTPWSHCPAPTMTCWWILFPSNGCPSLQHVEQIILINTQSNIIQTQRKTTTNQYTIRAQTRQHKKNTLHWTYLHFF